MKQKDPVDHSDTIISSLKVCTKCKKSLALDNFSKRGGENYLRTECKNCNKKLSKRRSVLRKHYGMPPGNYVCPICKRNKEECSGEGSNRASSWVIDHCHKTDKFRGWLCHKCNRGLGAFNDDISKLIRVFMYLVKSRIF